MNATRQTNPEITKEKNRRHSAGPILKWETKCKGFTKIMEAVIYKNIL